MALALWSAPSVAHACQRLDPFSFRTAGLIYFLGTALPDTLLAGSGGTEFWTHAGFGRPAERRIYGQTFRVDTVGGDRATGVRNALRADSLVVLVSWDEGPDCRPAQWLASARRTRPGTRGFVRGTLREERFWVNGIPTIDLYSPMAENPYESSGPRHRLGGWLTAEELFDLYEVMPEYRSLMREPERTVAPLVRWKRAHPELALREPANGVIRASLYLAQDALLRRESFPLAGSYRLTARLSGRGPVTFFVRTESRPFTGWGRRAAPLASEALEIPDSIPPAPSAYSVKAYPARHERALALSEEDAVRKGQYLSYFSLVAAPDSAADGTTTWRGFLDVAGEIGATMPAYARGRKAYWDLKFILAEMRRTTGFADAPAVFRRRPNGAVDVQQTITLPDGRVLAIRGQRVSTTTLGDSAAER